MKVIYNNIIPFKGFKAINLFGIVFARCWLTLQDLNHEAIHTQQMKEMLYVFFYIATFASGFTILSSTAIQNSPTTR